MILGSGKQKLIFWRHFLQFLKSYLCTNSIHFPENSQDFTSKVEGFHSLLVGEIKYNEENNRALLPCFFLFKEKVIKEDCS